MGGLRMMKPRVVVWILVLIVITIGSNRVEAAKEINVVCPLDGTKFKSPANVIGRQIGIQLDLKPIGFMDVPKRLPVCPSNHFVVYKTNFTDAEKERLLKFVLSQEYQDWAKNNPSYFLLGKIFEYMGDTDWVIANIYVQASWQVANKQPEKEKQYMDLTLQHLKKFLSTDLKEDSTDWISAQMLAGEMERRLGRFEDAQARFLKLSKSPEIQKSFNAQIVEYQLELISKKDSEPHLIPTRKR
jgi:hypothetical protein